MKPDVLTAERLRELVRYDYLTGEFTWLVDRTRGVKANDRAGSYGSDGRRYVSIGGKRYFAHRLAWLWMVGCWPPEDIDHIDGNHRNNRWQNLRAVSTVVNCQNQRRAHRRNGTGLLGASFDSATGRFVAQIKAGDRYVWLGRHATAEQAHDAYVEAKRRLHAGNTL